MAKDNVENKDINKKESLLSRYTQVMAILMSVFHLYTAGTIPFDVFVQRSVHLMFVFSMIFLLYPWFKKKIGWIDIIFTFLGMLSCIYISVNYVSISMQSGLSIGIQYLIGIMTVLLILEACRRAIGMALPILAIVFILYARFGSYIPGIWGHRGLSIERIFGFLYLTSDGIWSIPLGVSATTVVMFIIFGQFLNGAGVGEFFMEFSQAIAGKMIGGRAQVAVISSALFGTISGSSTANVATTGSFTIPLMKSSGYKPEFAGAVEAVASTGGQIMPPVMGAGAFIMAEMLGMRYFSICKAAAIPAILYFASVFLCVRFRSLLMGFKKERSSIQFKKVFLKNGYLIVPLIVIIYYIVQGFSPMRAAFYGVITTIIVSLLSRKVRENPGVFLRSLEFGAKNTVGVAIACSCAGIVLGIVSMTGLGIKMNTVIIAMSGGNIFYALFLAMFGSIILGMGLPTAVAYIIAAIVACPALIELGIAPLAAHMFVFYFAILGTITPPVCLSVYVASGIAQSNWLKTAYYAMMMALPGFIIPYVFVNDSSILLIGTTSHILRTSVTALIGIFALAVSMMGYFLTRVNIIERIFMAIAAILLIFPDVRLGVIGMIIVIIVYLYQKFRRREEVKQSLEVKA
jgi:TRAP transporter 4TM/12TM fusion protein